jgi:hypothetical protein
VETERNREKRKQQSKMDDRTQNENLPKDIPNNEKVLKPQEPKGTYLRHFCSTDKGI